MVIFLVSKDDVKFEVARDIIKMSDYLSKELSKQEHYVDDDDEDDEICFHPSFMLPTIDGATLRIVLEWCEKHKNDPPKKKMTKKEKRKEKIPEWDKKYFDVDQSVLFTVVKAAHDLLIYGLTDVLCKIVAGMLKGKTTEEMREIFHIKNDFTPEEEEALKQDNDRIIAERKAKKEKKRLLQLQQQQALEQKQQQAAALK